MSQSKSKSKPAQAMQTQRTIRRSARSRSPRKPKFADEQGGAAVSGKATTKAKTKSRSRSRDHKSELELEPEPEPTSQQQQQQKTDDAHLSRVANCVHLVTEERLNRSLVCGSASLLKLLTAAQRVSDWAAANQATVDSIAMRPTLKHKFAWYPHLHLLGKLGLPAKRIQKHVDALFGSFLTLQYGTNPQIEDQPGGWHHMFTVGDIQFSAACRFVDQQLPTDWHQDRLLVDQTDGVSIESIRQRLKMPELPLGILLDIITSLATLFGKLSEAESIVHHEDYTTADGKSTTTVVLNWEHHLQWTRFAVEVDPAPLVFGVARVDASRRKAVSGEWVLLKPGPVVLPNSTAYDAVTSLPVDLY